MRGRIPFFIPFILLVLWIVVAPVFLGSVPEAKRAEGIVGEFTGAGGGYALFVVLGVAAAATLLPSLGLRREVPLAPDRRSRWMLRALVGLGLLALLQLVPLPLGIHRLFSPGHAADLSVLSPGSSWAPISTDAGLTLRAAIFLGLLLLAGAVVLGAARGPRRAWTVVAALVAVATAGAVYGMLETHVLGNRVLAHEKGAADTGVTGTFFLRSNFVAFSAAALGAAAAALVAAFRRGRPLLAAGAAMSVPILAAGILLSKSRSGIGAAAIAVAVGMCMSLRTWRLRLAMGAVILAAFAAAFLSLGWVRERFGYMTESAELAFLDIRIPAWQSTLELVETRPVFGSGLGTYRRAIHLSQSPRIDRELWYAHSDPLNLLAEGGAVGLLLGGGLILLGILGAASGRRRSPPERTGVGAACLGGLAGMGVMALVDFPLQVPATALAFTVLLFLPAAARAPVRERVGTSRWAWAFAAAAILAVCFLQGSSVARWWRTDRPLTRGEELTIAGPVHLREGRRDLAVETLREARDLQPFDCVTRYQLAEALFRTEGPSDACRRELIAAHHVARGQKLVLYDVGTLAHRIQLRDLAARAFREACGIDHRLFNRAFAHFRVYDKEMAVAMVPERGFAHKALGDFYLDEGRGEEALGAYWHAVALGERGRVEGDLARAYRDLGREAEGRARFVERGWSWPD